MEIFKLFGSIFVNTDAADESMKKTEKNAESVASKLGAGIKTAAKWGAAMVAGAAAATTAIVGLATNAASTADEIDKMSQKIGISNEAYQEWSYVMGQNGMDVEKLSVGMKTLVAQMDMAASGTASAQENFEKLGISIYDASGKLKDQESILNETMHALAEMENGTEKSRLATELFGKAGIEMMPMLNQGAEAMDELTQRAHDLGLIMSDEAVTAGVTLGDTIDDIKQSFSMIGTQLGSAVIPIVQQFADLIINNMPTIQQMLSQLGPILANVASTFLPIVSDLVQMLLPVLIDLFNQIVPIVTEFANTILPVVANLLGMLLPPLMQIIKTLVPMLINLINQLMPSLLQIIEMLLPVLMELFNQLLPPIMQIVEMLMPALTDLLVTLIPLIVQIVEALLPPLMQIIESMMPLLSVLIELMMPIIEVVMDLLTPLIELVTEVLTPLIQMFAELLEDILPFLIPVITLLAQVFEGQLLFALEHVTNMVNSIIKVFHGVIDFVTGVFSGDWEKAWQGIVDIFSGIFAGIEGMVKFPLNQIITGINTVFKSLGEITIPDWVPEIGGTTFALPQIPLLAKGGDIRASGSVIVGEKGPELLTLPAGARVTPLSGNSAIGDIDELNNIMMNHATIIVNAIAKLQESGTIKVDDPYRIFKLVRDEYEKYEISTGGA